MQSNGMNRARDIFNLHFLTLDCQSLAMMRPHVKNIFPGERLDMPIGIDQAVKDA